MLCQETIVKTTKIKELLSLGIANKIYNSCKNLAEEKGGRGKERKEGDFLV